jgi:hypothetical protein
MPGLQRIAGGARQDAPRERAATSTVGIDYIYFGCRNRVLRQNSIRYQSLTEKWSKQDAISLSGFLTICAALLSLRFVTI